MPAPKVDHGGFLVPNAKDVSDPTMAEPDRIDFNTLGNNRWGVIEGCKVVVAGTTATTDGGTALVNGQLVVVGPRSANHGTGGTQDRHDLVVVDDTGNLLVVPGKAATDPVFPDLAQNQTLLASVFAPTGSGDFGANVLDKRNILSDALLTKLDPLKPLVYNLNGTGPMFSIRGDGQIEWSADTRLFREDKATLRLERNLNIASMLTVGDSISCGSLTASGTITGSNLRRGDNAGTASPGVLGAIFQQTTDGRLFVWATDETGVAKWQEIATVSGIVPVGSIIYSFEAPDVMIAKGWYPLKGDTISEEKYPRLFLVTTLTPYISAATQPGGPRSMTLPNFSRRVMIGGFTGRFELGGSETMKLLIDHMPNHGHNVRFAQEFSANDPVNVSVSQAGGHTHATWGGEHPHGVDEHGGHIHPGADFFGANLGYIQTIIGGHNKIDAEFNDRSHTYSVEKIDWTGTATTGISVTTAYSGHGHAMESAGQHGHTASVVIPRHSHFLEQDKVGGGQEFSKLPPYITVYTYVRT